MTIKFQDIVDAFENAGADCQKYSGRGMYGKECLAVQFDGSPVTIVLEAVEYFANTLSADEAVDQICEFMQMLKSPSQDSMGLGSVMYWPHIKWENGEDKEEDSEDEEGVAEDWTETEEA